MKKVKISNKLPSLNQFINKLKSNKYQGQNFKNDIEDFIAWELKSQCKANFERIGILFIWKEPDNMRDDDNVSSAHKYVLDAMQKLNIIEGDGKKQVFFDDVFLLDRSNKDGSVELIIYEYPAVKNEYERILQRIDLSEKKLDVYRKHIEVKDV